MGAYGLQDPTYQALTGADKDPSKVLAGIVSPSSADEIVGPPPDKAPDGNPGESTRRTGNLAAAPKQAVAKNMDTAAGRSSYNVQPAQPSSMQSPIGGLARPLQVGQSTLAPAQANRQQAYNATQPSVQPVNPDPNASLRPGGTVAMPVLPAAASPVAPAPQQKLAQDQALLQKYQQTGSGVSQIKNPFLRGAGKALDVAGSILAPGVTQFIPGSTMNNQRLQGIQAGRVANDQGQIQAAAQTADVQSQQAEREAQARKADALAVSDAPFNLSAAQAKQLGHPELEGEPMTNRVYGQLSAAHERGTAQITTGANHDDAAITKTGMNNDTSAANNAASNTSREAIADARDKTQTLLGNLRASVSTANNERTNQTHLTTAGLKGTGGAAGQPGAYKVPADVTKRAALASNVLENADEASKIVDRRSDLFGAGAGRITNVQQMMGSNDPDIAALGTRIHNMALAANGAHGLRSQEAVAQTEKELLNGFHNGPAAVKAALGATTSSVQTFLNDEKNFRQTGGRVAPPPPGGTSRDPNMLYARDPQGKLHAAPKAGAKPLPLGWKYDVLPAGGK